MTFGWCSISLAPRMFGTFQTREVNMKVKISAARKKMIEVMT